MSIRREIGDRREEGNILKALGNVARQQGDTTTAHTLYVEALSMSRETGYRLAEAITVEDVHGRTVFANQAEAQAQLAQSAKEFSLN